MSTAHRRERPRGAQPVRARSAPRTVPAGGTSTARTSRARRSGWSARPTWPGAPRPTTPAGSVGPTRPAAGRRRRRRPRWCPRRPGPRSRREPLVGRRAGRPGVLTLVGGPDVAQGVGTAVLGLHAFAKAALSRWRARRWWTRQACTGADRPSTAPRWPRRWRTRPGRCWARRPTTTGCCWHTSCTPGPWPGPPSVVRSLTARGVPMPLAVARAAEAPGCRPGRTGRYVEATKDPHLDDLVVADAADRALMGGPPTSPAARTPGAWPRRSASARRTTRATQVGEFADKPRVAEEQELLDEARRLAWPAASAVGGAGRWRHRPGGPGHRGGADQPGRVGGDRDGPRSGWRPVPSGGPVWRSRPRRPAGARARAPARRAGGGRTSHRLAAGQPRLRDRGCQRRLREVLANAKNRGVAWRTCPGGRWRCPDAGRFNARLEHLDLPADRGGAEPERLHADPLRRQHAAGRVTESEPDTQQYARQAVFGLDMPSRSLVARRRDPDMTAAARAAR